MPSQRSGEQAKAKALRGGVSLIDGEFQPKPAPRSRKRRPLGETGRHASSSSVRSEFDQKSENWLFPDLYLMFLGWELAINVYNKRKALEIKEWFMIRFLDIELLGIVSSRDMNYRFCLSIFGIRIFCFSSHAWFSFDGDTKVLPLFITVLLFMMLSHFGGYFPAPESLVLMVPAWATAMSELSLMQGLMGWRTFVMMVEILSAIFNSLMIIYDIGMRKTTKHGYFFHHRIWLFALLLPAILNGFYPLTMLILATVAIAIQDARNSDQGMMVLNWGLFGVHAYVFSYNREGMFKMLDFDTTVVLGGAPNWKEQSTASLGLADRILCSIARPIKLGMSRDYGRDAFAYVALQDDLGNPGADGELVPDPYASSSDEEGRRNREV